MTTPSRVDIHTAAFEGSTGLVKAALEADPDRLNAKDSDGRTPLHQAASGGRHETLRLLLEKGADVDIRDALGWTPLIIAVSSGSDPIITELVGAGANVNAKTDKDATPLHYAASKGRLEVGKMLISRGADINARDKANQLPLHRAATVGAAPFIRLLLSPSSSAAASATGTGSGVGGSNKPRLNLQDRAGNTPLHLAIESGHGEAAVALIEAGADRERRNTDGQIPEEIEGVGGQEALRVKKFIESRCGKIGER